MRGSQECYVLRLGRLRQQDQHLRENGPAYTHFRVMFVSFLPPSGPTLPHHRGYNDFAKCDGAVVALQRDGPRFVLVRIGRNGGQAFDLLLVDRCLSI